MDVRLAWDGAKRRISAEYSTMYVGRLRHAQIPSTSPYSSDNSSRRPDARTHMHVLGLGQDCVGFCLLSLRLAQRAEDGSSWTWGILPELSQLVHPESSLSHTNHAARPASYTPATEPEPKPSAASHRPSATTCLMCAQHAAPV